MRRRNLIFPFIIGSIFIPSIESVTINDSFENKYNFYEAVEIASGNYGGTGSNRNSGGIMTVEQKKEKCIKDAQKSIQFFKKELIKKENAGESTVKIKNKLIKYEKKYQHAVVKLKVSRMKNQNH